MPLLSSPASEEDEEEDEDEAAVVTSDLFFLLTLLAVARSKRAAHNLPPPPPVLRATGETVRLPPRDDDDDDDEERADDAVGARVVGRRDGDGDVDHDDGGVCDWPPLQIILLFFARPGVGPPPPRALWLPRARGNMPRVEKVHVASDGLGANQGRE